MLSRASLFDLTAAVKQIMLNSAMTHSGYLLADKAYIDSEWAKTLEQEHGLKIITPREKTKDDTLSSGDAYSTSVSTLRQLIESFFNWLNNRFLIQRASFIRSAEELHFYVFSAIAAALFF